MPELVTSLIISVLPDISTQISGSVREASISCSGNERQQTSIINPRRDAWPGGCPFCQPLEPYCPYKRHRTEMTKMKDLLCGRHSDALSGALCAHWHDTANGCDGDPIETPITSEFPAGEQTAFFRVLLNISSDIIYKQAEDCRYSQGSWCGYGRSATPDKPEWVEDHDEMVKPGTKRCLDEADCKESTEVRR